MCYEIVIFPIRKRHFRVRGWSGAFSEPLERKKDKTKCSYKICILLHLWDPKCKNHNEKPPGNSYKQASSKQSPGEQYRAGKQTSDKDY